MKFGKIMYLCTGCSDGCIQDKPIEKKCTYLKQERVVVTPVEKEQPIRLDEINLKGSIYTNFRLSDDSTISITTNTLEEMLKKEAAIIEPDPARFDLVARIERLETWQKGCADGYKELEKSNKGIWEELKLHVETLDNHTDRLGELESSKETEPDNAKLIGRCKDCMHFNSDTRICKKIYNVTGENIIPSHWFGCICWEKSE